MTRSYEKEQILFTPRFYHGNHDFLMINTSLNSSLLPSCPLLARLFYSNCGLESSNSAPS